MNLTNNKIKNSYGGVLNIGATGFSGNQMYRVTDGFGNPTPWYLSETGVDVLGTFSVNGVVFDPESGYHGAFYSNIIQSNAGATATNKVSFNGTYLSNDVVIQNGTEITFLEKATYDIQFSLQYQKSGGGDSLVQIWFQKNGQNVPESNTEITIHGNNGKVVAAWDFMEYLNAGDYIEICWHSTDTSVILATQPALSNPARPAIPSAIVSALQITNILTGAPGATGPTGAPGPTGISVIGPQGPQGDAGVNGAQGVAGPQGIIGFQGLIGNQGSIGFQGVAGSNGVQGQIGPQGVAGSNGVQGNQGPIGFQGVAGSNGVQGQIGPQGVAGSNGVQGNQGPIGFQGLIGNQGPIGPQGLRGFQGLIGNQGSIGFQGLRGFQGFQGLTGIDGPAGADAGLSLRYRVETTSGAPIPSIGKVTTDAPDVVDITTINFDIEDFYTVDAKPYWNQLVTWLSIPMNKASLIITTIESPSVKGIFPITGITFDSINGYFNITLDAPIYSNGSLSIGFTLVTSWVGEAIGLPGPTGPQGDIGFQGFQGLTGPQGAQGIQGPLPISSIITLTDAATISWTYSIGQTARVTINGNRALAINGATAGDYGSLILTHGTTNSIITTFPNISDFVGGTYSFSANANTIDIFSWVYDGSIYYWVYNNDFK